MRDSAAAAQSRLFWRVALGCIWIFLGGYVVPKAAYVLSPDGEIQSFYIKTAIFLAAAGCLLMGLLSFSQRVLRNNFFQKINLCFFSLIILTPFCAELFFRTGIALNHPFFKNPALYADFYTDDNFWKLQYLWRKGKDLSWIPPHAHSLLGWTQAPVSSENPMGLQKDTFDRLKTDGREKILFYGDSFIKGRASKDFELPKYLNGKIPGADVLDLGMSGFGADQIYLMFRETHKKVDKPLVLMGILVEDDMDRTILKFRSGPKPYFVPDSKGGISLRGVPVNLSAMDYVKQNPPRLYSYTYQFLRMKFFKNDRGPEKMFINSRLIDNIQRSCEKQGASLVYVLFYGRTFARRKVYPDLAWRETFIKSELTKRGIDFIDTKTAIMEYAAKKNGDISDLYFPREGHHSSLGNQIIGDEILKHLKAKGHVS